MGKVLKIVAVIAIAAAVAYFAPQISAAILAGTAASAATTAAVTAAVATALTAAASIAMSVLASKPRSDATPSIYRQSLGNSWIVYGKRRVGGLMVFFHPLYAGKFHYRFFVIAVAGHRCKGVTRWFLNDEEVTVRGDGLVLSGKYANDAWLWFGRGTDQQEAPATFLTDTNGKWTNAHVGAGVAKIFAKFRMTDDVIAAGMPNITAEIEGKDDIADPRTGAVGYVRNAALVFYDWMRLPREAGGFGAYADEIDDDWVSAQANVCDEKVPLKSGGTEPRYVFDSYLQTGSPPSEVRDTFVTCCAGTFTYSGGRMLMRPGYYVPPSATLLEHDLAGPIVVPALRPSNEIVTEVAATYVDPTMYAGKDAPTRSVPTDDVRQGALDLPHITSGTAAQRIAEITLRKAQAERRVQWPMNIAGIGVSTLDTVQLRTSRYGLGNYAFQVANWQLGQDFGVTLSLEEHSPDIFEWTPAMELAVGEAPMLESADAIDDRPGRAAHQIVAQTVAYPVTTTATSISIQAFGATLDDGRVVDLPAGQIDGLDDAASYRLFYALKDATLAFGGTDGQTFIGTDDQPFAGIVPAGQYYAAPSDSLLDAANSAFVVIRLTTTANADGTTYPPTETPPGGDSGSGYGGGGRYQQQVAQ